MNQVAGSIYLANGPGSRHVGHRYLAWSYYEEKHLTPEQKAQAEDAFADQFAALPAAQEPYAGWALLMSELCRRAARKYRGLEVGEWPHALPKPADDVTSDVQAVRSTAPAEREEVSENAANLSAR